MRTIGADETKIKEHRMIFFKFIIDNPWHKPQHAYIDKDYLYKHGSITKYKHAELQISRFASNELASVNIDLRWRGRDHAGVEIELCVVGYIFNAKIYDSRHWDHATGNWEI